MKNTKTTAQYCFEQLEVEIESFMESICFDDAIRMQFMEQSAMYLGVFVANEPDDLLDSKAIN